MGTPHRTPPRLNPPPRLPEGIGWCPPSHLLCSRSSQSAPVTTEVEPCPFSAETRRWLPICPTPSRPGLYPQCRALDLVAAPPAPTLQLHCCPPGRAPPTSGPLPVSFAQGALTTPHSSLPESPRSLPDHLKAKGLFVPFRRHPHPVCACFTSHRSSIAEAWAPRSLGVAFVHAATQVAA